ncbi:hypothetical protein I6A60_31225 [Frankia sp. AgB1.9]|uniref:hypothetical protein n=1 Tax=unclassified Frankia TaxID=2632575 RepID=UPI0019347691|nr:MULTISPECIES: hypothetical protein [unclassified Frankia]MBL7493019.1 hypothetical protein [Frankia sp. AgW1.1]MBL7552302.1 hypothetical protein [Frankia sp. AgB1.9]MBL7622055.1 hypothetical protein [Frankia sp. AgB1.8]
MQSLSEPATAPAEPPAEAPAAVAGHRVDLPVPCTVADLRAALRRMNGADRIVDVRLANAHGMVWLAPVDGVELTVQVSA